MNNGDAKPKLEVKPTKPAKQAKATSKPTSKKPPEKPARNPVPKAVLEKLAANGGKVKIVAARDVKLIGRTAEVVSVATIAKTTYAFGYFPRIKLDGKVRNVSPANVKV